MNKKPYFALFISVVSVSFAAIFIVSCNAPSLSIAFFRLLFTFLLLLPFVIFSRNCRKEMLNISKKDFLLMTIIGIILAFHFALWITSLKYTSVASSVILVTAHPLLVGPISHFLFKEKLSFINSIGICLSVFGVFILVYGNYGFSSMGGDTFEGNILAILGGIAAGLYILGGRKIRKNVSVRSYALTVYFIATIILFLLCLVFNSPIINLSLQDYGIILLMAVVAGIFGHTLYNWSLKYIRASLASVALLGEPIGSSILAYFLPWINQLPTKFTIIGGAFILFGIYLTAKRYKDFNIP